MTSHPARPSNLFRAAACPPSIWREREVPEVAHEDASLGTRLHAAVACAYRHGDYYGLTDAQVWAVDKCLKLVREVSQGCELPAFEEDYADRSKPDGEDGFVCQDSYGSPLFSRTVKPDFFCLYGTAATVIDFKMLFGVVPFPACDDLQLRAYALTVRNTFEGIGTVRVIRFHPQIREPEFQRTEAVYSGDDAYWIMQEQSIKEVILNSRMDAPANPDSYACKYCKAKPFCAEFKAGTLPALFAQGSELVTPEQLTDFLTQLPRFRLAIKMVDDGIKLAKAALAGGMKLPGWMLEPGRTTRELELSDARARLVDTGLLPAPALDAACKVSLPKLEAQFKSHTGLKGKALKEALSDAVTLREGEPMLKQVEAATEIKMEEIEDY